MRAGQRESWSQRPPLEETGTETEVMFTITFTQKLNPMIRILSRLLKVLKKQTTKNKPVRT